MESIIRKAIPEDAKGITEVLTYTWLTTYKGLLPNSILEKRVQTMDERIKKTKESLEKKDNRFVAIADNKIVGVISYGKSRNENFPDCGEINAIYVLKEYQGYGIGKKLFFSGIQELINNGYERMILNVLKGNKTINFYEYFGGKKIDSRFESFDDEIIEEYIMFFDDLKEILEKEDFNITRKKKAKKIVAIGGGENGRISSNGEQKPYETLEIDQEIVRLSEKENPKLLFLAHSQIPFGEEAEERYYNVVKKIYEKLGCEVKWLKVSDLEKGLEKAKIYVEWADIIYEGGGATDYMIEFWKETGFNEVLKDAWESGKVMCGVSAGAICWFNSGFTDSPEYVDKEFNKIDALNFIDAYLTPHIQIEGKLDRVRTSLKYFNKVGVSLSNCCAIEIIDEEFKIIKSKPADESFEPYALKSYWDKDEMFEEELTNTEIFENLDDLLNKKLKNEYFTKK